MMESNLSFKIREWLRQRSNAEAPSASEISCFKGKSHTEPRHFPYSYEVERFGKNYFPSNDYWIGNIDGIFINYQSCKGGVVIDTRIYRSEVDKQWQRKAIESFNYSDGSIGCIFEFLNGTAPHNSITVVRFYDGMKWHKPFKLNEIGVVDFLREASGTPLHPSDSKWFIGPYRPTDVRGNPVIGERTMFLEWVRLPHLLCSKCCHFILFDVDLFIMNKRTHKSVMIERKNEREFTKDKEFNREWIWSGWIKNTTKYISANITRLYAVFWDSGRVLNLPIKKDLINDEDVREDSPQNFDTDEQYANYIKNILE